MGSKHEESGICVQLQGWDLAGIPEMWWTAPMAGTLLQRGDTGSLGRTGQEDEEGELPFVRLWCIHRHRGSTAASRQIEILTHRNLKKIQKLMGIRRLSSSLSKKAASLKKKNNTQTTNQQQDVIKRRGKADSNLTGEKL